MNETPNTPTLAKGKQRIKPMLLLIVLLVLAFVVRFWLMWPIIIDDRYFDLSDDGSYHRLAISLVEHGTLTLRDQPSAYRMPLFPLFIAAIYWIAGPNRIIAQAVILLLSVVNVGLAYTMGRQLGNQRIAIIAAIITLLDLDQIDFAGQLMTETLCIFLLTMSLLTLVALQRRGEWRWAVGTGILLGLTALVRVNILLLVPVLAAWVLRYGAGTLRKRIALIVILGALCGGLWSTWVIRNYRDFGMFIPLTTQSGNGYLGIYNDQAAAPQPLSSFGEWRNLDLPAEILQASEVEQDRMQRQLAFTWIRANPTKAAQIALAQIYQFWRDYINPLYLPTMVFAIIGLYLLIRRADPIGMLWLFIFVTMTISAIITVAVARFHFPLLPGIAVLAGIAIDRIWQQIAPYLPKRFTQRTA